MVARTAPDRIRYKGRVYEKAAGWGSDNFHPGYTGSDANKYAKRIVDELKRDCVSLGMNVTNVSYTLRKSPTHKPLAYGYVYIPNAVREKANKVWIVGILIGELKKHGWVQGDFFQGFSLIPLGTALVKPLNDGKEGLANISFADSIRNMNEAIIKKENGDLYLTFEVYWPLVAEGAKDVKTKLSFSDFKRKFPAVADRYKDIPAKVKYIKKQLENGPGSVPCIWYKGAKKNQHWWDLTTGKDAEVKRKADWQDLVIRCPAHASDQFNNPDANKKKRSK